jgi:hypothetical protein
LSKERPYRGYTWWIGFAPSDKPEIALASLVVNEPRWHIKAADLAREAMQHWFEHARVAKRTTQTDESAAPQTAPSEAKQEDAPSEASDATAAPSEPAAAAAH